MFKSVIKIFGVLDTEPKISNGKVFFTLRNEMNKRDNSESVFYLEVTNKQWEKIKLNYMNRYVEISGEIQAKVTKKGIPFIYVKCQNILIVKKRHEEIKKKKFTKKLELEEDKKEVEKEVKKVKPHWSKQFSEEDFIYIDINDIEIIEKVHSQGFVGVNLQSKNRYPVAVRKLDNGSYALVAGIRSYTESKLKGSTVKAYITELNHKQFEDKYCVRKR